MYLYNLVERPCCPTCNKELTYKDRSVGYNKYCSYRCSARSIDTQKKRKETKERKYGDKNYSNKEKAVKTKKESGIMKRAAEKAARTKDRRYGDAKYNNNEKAKKTKIEKYGTSNLWEVPAFREQIKQSNKEKYGVDWGLANKDIIKKSKERKKYNFYQNTILKFTNVSPLFSVDEFKGVDLCYDWLCRNCGQEFSDHIDDGSIPVCRTCYPRTHGVSLGETEIRRFVENQIESKVIFNDKSLIGKELDILIPELRLAIEYNGLYWHGENKILNTNYHLNKLELVEQSGYRLITIFSDEWEQKRKIVENRLKHALGANISYCYGRDCEVRIIDTDTYKEFLQKTHIQGHCATKYKYGAVYKDELVAVMGFGKRKISREAPFELLRYATKYNIPGVASKIFQRFVKDHRPLDIVSYCDRRWGTGDLYINLGFQLEAKTSPCYWYSKDGVKRSHRYNFRKDKLVSQGYPLDRTEKEIMQSRGYYRIWDCGNLKFRWSLQ